MSLTECGQGSGLRDRTVNFMNIPVDVALDMMRSGRKESLLASASMGAPAPSTCSSSSMIRFILADRLAANSCRSKMRLPLDQRQNQPFSD